jgi:hypothetical protein
MDYLDKLKTDHPLFTHLLTDKPAWWPLLREQKDCYIDIRKDNTINIYYRGASLFRIACVSGEFRFHTAYSDKPAPLVAENITPAAIEAMKTAIRKNRKFACGSESAIKADIVCRNPEYIDSEFAHPAVDADGKPKVIRIDLVRLRDNIIEFVELKRFGDNRLLDKKSYTAPTGKEEIVKQIDEYQSFLHDKHDELIRYYSNLLEMKRKLGLFLGVIPANLTLADKVVLLIDMTDYNDSDGQRSRREKLRELIEYADITAETTNGMPL